VVGEVVVDGGGGGGAGRMHIEDGFKPIFPLPLN